MIDSLRHLRKCNESRQKEWSGADKVGALFRAVEFGEEAGEVLRAVKKIVRTEQGITGNGLEVLDLAHEIGDALVTLDLLAIEYGLDLDLCWRTKFNHVSRKHGMVTRA